MSSLVWARLDGQYPRIKTQRGTRLPLIVPPEGCEKRLNPHKITYTPLPTETSIRLLRIEPLEKLADEFDMFRPVRCTLEVADLADCPVYDALSYTWGCPVTFYESARDVCSPAAWAAPAFDITCNGKPFSITTNLYTALLSIRYRTAVAQQYLDRLGDKKDDMESEGRSFTIRNMLTRYIWIDQICINQQDRKEREAQVMLMGRIYQGAQKVPAWIGGEDTFTRDGCETLMYLVSLATQDKLGRDLQNLNIDISNPESLKRAGLEPVPPHKWLALYALFSRTWFGRSWIAQEAVLGKFMFVCCGMLVLDFPNICVSVEALQTTKWFDTVIEWVLSPRSSETFKKLRAQPGWREFYQADPLAQRPNLSLPRSVQWLRTSQLGYKDSHMVRRRNKSIDLSSGLLAALTCFRKTIATDPRDKIYAFLGIADAIGHPSNIRPDYSKSPKDVFLDAMSSLLLSSVDLDALAMKEDSLSTKLLGLPSWGVGS